MLTIPLSISTSFLFFLFSPPFLPLFSPSSLFSSSWYPNYINVTISSILLVISWEPCSRSGTLSIPGDRQDRQNKRLMVPLEMSQCLWNMSNYYWWKKICERVGTAWYAISLGASIHTHTNTPNQSACGPTTTAVRRVVVHQFQGLEIALTQHDCEYAFKNYQQQ